MAPQFPEGFEPNTYLQLLIYRSKHKVYELRSKFKNSKKDEGLQFDYFFCLFYRRESSDVAGRFVHGIYFHKISGINHISRMDKSESRMPGPCSKFAQIKGRIFNITISS